MSPDWDGAAEGTTDDVLTMQTLAERDSPKLLTVNSGALLEATDVSEPGTFPEYGTFLETMDEDGEPVYVEACRDLKVFLDIENVSVGDDLKLIDARKDKDGNWSVAAETA